MWRVNVVLVVASTNENYGPNLSILFDKNGCLPTINLQTMEKSLSIAQGMVENLLGFRCGWAGANPVQRGVFENEDVISVVYYLLVPQEIKQENVRWVKIDNMHVDDLTQNIIRYAIL